MLSTRTGNRIFNIVSSIASIVWIRTVVAKGPDFLGFYRLDDLQHVLYDVGIFCGYLVVGGGIYLGFVPKQKQTTPELGAAQK